MRLLYIGISGLLAWASSVFAQTTFNFDALPLGPLATPWLSGVTGRGVSKWEVVADELPSSKHHMLKQSGEAKFTWAVKTDLKIRNGFAEAKFKALAGHEDQAGGLVWRWIDADNYYVVRGNALEGNVVLYKTERGERTALSVKGRLFGYGVDADLQSGKWNALRVEFTDKLFTVFFNGKQLFQVEDDTFKEAGAVGLWTKADSVTVFDQFTYGEK